ncbi:hypothetical protein SADUNF_Sadunf08G0053800 [Salix dunnii]|uniref:HMG box domain-containing protein n=1 Tax=Salix dunnii TaxID=1413687 RepID=A0A835JXG9_9ROSI|nr:hypothetical protein SADUNF_Sadunf08G0053800 [Salix dunnii]
MKNAKGKGAARTEKKEVSLPVEDRKIGKRKAALKASESSKKRVMKEKITKKDPNKPKRPPSSFFVFLEEFRTIYKQEHPNMKAVSAVGKAGGEKWKSMSASNTFTRKTVRILFVKVLRKPGTVAPTGPGRALGACSMTLELCREKAPYEAKAAKRKSDYGKLMTAYNKKQETDDGGGDQDDEHGQSHGSKSEVNGQDDSDESVEVPGIVLFVLGSWDCIISFRKNLPGSYAPGPYNFLNVSNSHPEDEDSDDDD